MKYITDKEIANLLGITEKSYIYQSKTKERIELICNELIKRMETKHLIDISNIKKDIIEYVKAY